MKLYKTIADNGSDRLTLWAGTQADAASARKTFVQSGYKRAEVETVEVDVPTNKAGLLDFLNLGAAQQ